MQGSEGTAATNLESILHPEALVYPAGHSPVHLRDYPPACRATGTSIGFRRIRQQEFRASSNRIRKVRLAV